jgi:hypothetical protein
MRMSHRLRARGDGASQGPLQVVLRIAVAAGKVRAGETENLLNLDGRRSLKPQTPGNPKVHDAPVRLGKAFEYTPSPQALAIDRDSFRGLGLIRLASVRRPRAWSRGRVACGWWAGAERFQQSRAPGRQERAGEQQFHPGG